VLKFCVLAGMLSGLPFVGAFLAGLPLSRYMEFPPRTLYILHEPFSWVAFVGYGIFALSVILPLLLRILRSGGENIPEDMSSFGFPWWGWLGIVTGVISWILAWTRLSWFCSLQSHTFTPLWLSFILVVNALTFRRKGRCMIVDRPRLFLLLFPASALFWWFFEYLNRFVQNWHYIGVDFSSLEYLVYSSVSFSTVLPAVLGTREWLLCSPRLENGFRDFFPLRVPRTTPLAGLVLIFSGIGLAGIGVWPNVLFPLLWVSPLLIIVSLQAIIGEHHVFSDTAIGNWRPVVSSASSALLCGWFWEMWNYYSLAKWQYTLPFVDRYHIFEMPVLGFVGYLPFGLECAAVGQILETFIKGRKTESKARF
jgi:hypothetical protein